MFFTIDEVVRWLGLTIFEIWVNLIASLVFTILLALKHTDFPQFQLDWWYIFLPLFAADALNAYFCIIVFIRKQFDSPLKVAIFRISWSAFFLFMMFLFKFLLCKKFMELIELDYYEIFTPLYILLQIIAVRACQQS